MHKNQ